MDPIEQEQNKFLSNTCFVFIFIEILVIFALVTIEWVSKIQSDLTLMFGAFTLLLSIINICLILPITVICILIPKTRQKIGWANLAGLIFISIVLLVLVSHSKNVSTVMHV